ncbi:MAG: hypothetical protein R8K20_03735 [Gallionellaceae bacterium]
MAIRKVIHLKINVQREPHSYKLDVTAQLLILMIVFSVLALIFVLFFEKGLINVAFKFNLTYIQIWLFAAGNFTLFIAALLEEMQEHDFINLNDKVRRVALLTQLAGRTRNCREEIQAITCTIESAAKAKFKDRLHESREQREEVALFRLTKLELDNLSCLIHEAKVSLKTFSMSSQEQQNKDHNSPVGKEITP